MLDTDSKRDLSLYVHIPFCKAKCSYCDFLSFGNCSFTQQKEYMNALLKEISAYQDVADAYIIRTIFIGGGTPSFVDSEWIVQIMDRIHQVFHVDENAEVTIEGNPDSLTMEHLSDYKKAGINRLSIGLQSANNESLKRLSRVHNYDQFVAAYLSARQVGFQNINVDLMAALPGETIEDYIHTLAKVVEMGPEHISAYSLIVEDGTALSEDETLLSMIPSEEVDRQMYYRTKKLLKNCGYSRYEISNYSKPGFECKHNMVYWTGGEYLGVGLGASSCLDVQLENGSWKRVRFHGVENMNEYIGRFIDCSGVSEDQYTNMFHTIEDFYEDGFEEDFVETSYYADYLYESTKAASDNLKEYRELEANALLEFLRDYYKDLYFLKKNDSMEEMMFLGLRMMQGVSKSEFQKRFGVSMEHIYGRIIDKYKNKGLLLEENGRIFLSDAGIDVSNVIMADFMI
ncbi:MAG: radical SAM family heme chaperone HemW [Lachnospiraceae bacterium]